MISKYLSPLDRFMRRHYTPQILCFRCDDPRPQDILKSGLEKAIKEIPFLALSVVQKEGTARPHDVELGEPRSSVSDILSVLDKTTSCAFANLESSDFPLERLDRLEMRPDIPDFGSLEPAPVLRVRMTLLRGGFVLHVAAHHCACDLGTLTSVYETWAFHCRGEGLTSGLFTPQCFDRSKLVESAGSQQGTDLRAKGLFSKTQALGASSTPQSPPSLTNCRFHFPTERLQTLKCEVMTWAKKNASDVEYVSTNDLLSAILWASVANAKEPPPRAGDEFTLGVAIDMRPYLRPELPTKYLGCAINMCWTTLPRSLVMAAASSPTALAQVVTAIRNSISALNKAEMQNFIAQLAATDDLAALRWGPETTELAITSWAGQESYELDWGPLLGRCCAVRTRKLSPGCVILPRRSSPQTDDGVGVIACYGLDVMERFKDCELLRKHSELRR